MTHIINEYYISIVMARSSNEPSKYGYSICIYIWPVDSFDLIAMAADNKRPSSQAMHRDQIETISELISSCIVLDKDKRYPPSLI